MSSTRQEAREGLEGSVTSPEDSLNSSKTMNANEYTSKKANSLSNYYRVISILMGSTIATTAASVHSFINPDLLDGNSTTALKEDEEIGSGIATAATIFLTALWLASKHFLAKDNDLTPEELVQEALDEAQEMKSQKNPWHRRVRTGFALGSTIGSGIAQALSILPMADACKRLVSGIFSVIGGLIGGIYSKLFFKGDPGEYHFVCCKKGKPELSKLKKLSKEKRESALFLYLENDKLRWSYVRESDGPLISTEVPDEDNSLSQRFERRVIKYGRSTLAHEDLKAIYEKIETKNKNDKAEGASDKQFNIENYYKKTDYTLGVDGWSKYTKAGLSLGMPIGAAIGAVLGTFVFPGIGTAIGAGIGTAIGGLLGFAGFAGGIPLYNKIKKYLNPDISKTPDPAPFRSSYFRFGTTLGMAVGVIAGFTIGCVIPVIGPLLGILIGAGILALIGTVSYAFIGPWLTKKYGDKCPSSPEYGGRGAEATAKMVIGSPMATIFKKMQIGDGSDPFKELVKAIVSVVALIAGHCFDLYLTIKNKNLSKDQIQELRSTVVLPWSQRVPTFASFGVSVGAIIGCCIGLIGGPAGALFGSAIGAAVGGTIFSIVGAWQGDWILKKIDQGCLFLINHFYGAESKIEEEPDNDLKNKPEHDTNPEAGNTTNITQSLHSQKQVTNASQTLISTAPIKKDAPSSESYPTLYANSAMLFPKAAPGKWDNKTLAPFVPANDLGM